METYYLYNQLLQKRLTFNKGFAMIMIFILVTLLIFCIINKLKSMVITIVVAGIGIVSIIHFMLITPYKQDIEKSAYIKHVGDFYVERSYGTRGGDRVLIKFGEDKTIQLDALCGILELEDNTDYSGTVVYSKYSKCLVDIILDT